MNNLRQRLFIIISLIVVIILAIIFYLNYRRNTSNLPAAGTIFSGQPAETSDPGGDTAVNQAPGDVKQEVVTKPYSEDIYVRQLAKIFVERFNSYSNQDDNGHINDTLSLASPEMQTWLKAQMKVDSRDYEGIVTSVLATKLSEKTADKATILIEAQQVLEKKVLTATGPVTREERMRKGRVALVQIGGAWLVDGLYWDKI